MVNTPNDSTQQSQVNTTVTFSEPIENRPRGYLICGSPSSSFSFIPSIISTVSFILSVASLSVCNFYQRDVTFDSSRSEPTATNFLTTTRGIGFFTYAGSGEFEGLCLQYPGYIQKDAFLETSQAFAILATVFGGFAMIMLWFASCIPFSPYVFHATGIILLCATLFQGLSFLLIHSKLCTGDSVAGLIQTSVSCTLTYGSRMAIAATTLFFVGGLSSLTVPPPDIPDALPVQQKTTVTETRHANGTIETVTKTELVENLEYE